jgi:hypothetical protein
MTDPDPVAAAMQEAQCLDDDQSGIDPVPVDPGANALREDILDPNPKDAKTPFVSLEAEQHEPGDQETIPMHDLSLVSPDGESSEPTNVDGPGIIEDRLEMLLPKQTDEPPQLIVNKITWPRIGRVTDPGRYMYRFGWLTVTIADLAIWKAHPNAVFTLVKSSGPPPGEVEDELADEFRLGTFELRSDSNYSDSEK